METAGGPCFVWREILQMEDLTDDMAKMIPRLSKKRSKLNQKACKAKGELALTPTVPDAEHARVSLMLLEYDFQSSQSTLNRLTKCRIFHSQHCSRACFGKDLQRFDQRTFCPANGYAEYFNFQPACLNYVMSNIPNDCGTELGADIASVPSSTTLTIVNKNTVRQKYTAPPTTSLCTSVQSFHPRSYLHTSHAHG